MADMPEEHASRRERFAELDQLQPGWTVQLRSRGETIDARFISPQGAFACVICNLSEPSQILKERSRVCEWILQELKQTGGSWTELYSHCR